MSSDYHDVPHCIRQALAASPAPTHYSRISESPSHDDFCNREVDFLLFGKAALNPHLSLLYTRLIFGLERNSGSNTS